MAAPAACVLLSGCGQHAGGRRVPLAAVVNGMPVTQQELSRDVQYSQQYYGATQGVPAERCVPGRGDYTCRVLQRQVLNRLVQERVIMQYAAQHHLTITGRDRRRVDAALRKLSAVHQAPAALLRTLLFGQVLVEKVEAAVTPARALRGPMYHIRKYVISPLQGIPEHVRYAQAVSLATDGKPVPDGTNILDEWEAPFRLPHDQRNALQYAARNQFAGPFHVRDRWLVIQLRTTAVRTYGRPAQTVIAQHYFSRWLMEQMLHSHVQCFNVNGSSMACPATKP